MQTLIDAVIKQLESGAVSPAVQEEALISLGCAVGSGLSQAPHLRLWTAQPALPLDSGAALFALSQTYIAGAHRLRF